MFGLAMFLVTGADTTVGFDPLTLIGTIVTPTVVVLLFLTRKIVPGGELVDLREELARCRKTIEAKDEQLAAAQAAIVDKAIPALVQSTHVLESLSPLVQTEVSWRRPHGGRE